MTRPLLLYAVLRAQAAKNLLTKSGVPWPITFASTAFGIGLSFQFAGLMGDALGAIRVRGPEVFAAIVGLTLITFQLVFAFVSVGSISIRMFDARRVAEVEVFAALPLRRFDRFLMQLADVALVPLGMIFGIVIPSMWIAGTRANLPLPATILLCFVASLVSFQPLPALVAIYAGGLRVTPAAILRNRALLFALFVLAVIPSIPVLGSILAAAKARSGPAAWLPAAWAASAMENAERNRWDLALMSTGWITLVTALLCVAAYVAYDRAFMERFDEVLAKLSLAPVPEDAEIVKGRERRASLLAPQGNRMRSALLRKEMLGISRDPALQLTIAGMGAAALTFALLASRDLGVLATAGIAFLAVYLAACLGLASFSLEGRGFPVLAPLPIDVDEVLRAKLFVNSAALAISGAAGGAAFGLALGDGVLLGVLSAILFATLAALAAAPLGALATAMAALFPRRLQRTGRREINPLAMSFFTALTTLFYLSIGASFAAPALLGTSFLWVPAAVIAAWLCLAAALVSAARRAVRLGRTEA